jgi:hypothetical protein
VRLGSVDLVEASDCDGRKDRFHNQPRPDAREIVLDASTVAEKGSWQREQPQHNGVQPDERIKNEIRTCATQPPVPLPTLLWHRYGRTSGRPAQVGNAFLIDRAIPELWSIQGHFS